MRETIKESEVSMSMKGKSLSQTSEKVVYDASRRHDYQPFGDVAQTVQAHYGTGGGNVPLVQQSIVFENHSQDSRFRELGDICQTVSATYGMGGNNQPLVVKNSDSEGDVMEEENMVVRRLTPLECERLQGYPDNWTNIGDWRDSKGKLHKGDSDAPRYKALGNSICLPYWQVLARKITAQYDRDCTMGSLFDGIGGFPLVFSRVGCMPVWASEIEEFPIAVTKIHFPEREESRE